MGHIISIEGVAVDPAKLEAMAGWPVPKNIKELRGFLGLTDYYWKFVAKYGPIALPLTQLLKKGNFLWNNEAEEAFQRLKTTMISILVLGIPDFSQPFVVETDASEVGISVVLMQNKRPLAYSSRRDVHYEK